MDMGVCISKLALNKEFSDVSIVVGQDGEVFPAHKLILAARSEYFRKMLYGSQMKEARDGVCTFLYDDPRVFKTMLYHLYTRPLEEQYLKEFRHLVMCLITAEKYGIDSFSAFCLQTLEDALAIDSACEILALLEEIFDEHPMVRDLSNKCYSYILENLEAILGEDKHKMLTRKTFERILQTPSLSCLEIDLYKAVVSWHVNSHGNLTADRDSLLKQLAMLDLKLIDLGSLAELVHVGGIFTRDEMAELYRLRITLGQFQYSSRSERKFAIIFHGGLDYGSRVNDVVANLAKADILIDGMDVINFSNQCNFTYADLMQYSAIMVFSMETRSLGLCGDALADYVDKGGCVVLCQAMGCIGGRISTNQYMPVERLEPYSGEYKSFSLGKMANSTHPLFKGVKDVRARCGPNFVWNCKAAENATVIAQWNDGTILACERECGKGRVMLLNLYPVSTRVVIVGVEKECDGHTLLGNALVYAAYHPCKWL